MNRVGVWTLLGVALQGCAAATASPTAPIAVSSPIEQEEGAAGENSAEPAAAGEVAAQEVLAPDDVPHNDVDPTVTEACVNACRAAGGEALQGVDDGLAEAERGCRAGPARTLKRCLATAHDEYVEARQAAEGGEHACRTNCPGYLNQYP
jgi:hypothetical protein